MKSQSIGKSLYQKTHDRYLMTSIFNFVSDCIQFSNIHRLMQIQMGDCVCLCHGFLHSFLERVHWNLDILLWAQFSMFFFAFGSIFIFQVSDNIIFQYSTFFPCSLDIFEVNFIFMCKHSDRNRCQNRMIMMIMVKVTINYMIWLIVLRNFNWFLLFFYDFIDCWLLPILYLHEQITNFANLGLFIINFGNDTFLGSCDFSELLIRLNICNFLELGDLLTFSNIKFFDGALFNLFSQIRQWELDLGEREINPCKHGFTQGPQTHKVVIIIYLLFFNPSLQKIGPIIEVSRSK